MATYIDKSAATDGAGTEGDPRNVVPTLNSSGEYLFAGGVDIGEQLTVSADNVTLGSYGTGTAVINGAGAIDYGVYATSVSGLTVNDLEIHDVAKNGVLVENDVASSTEINVAIRRLHVYNVGIGSALPARTTEPLSRLGIGICVGSGPTTGLAVINGVNIDDCEVHDCGSHGIDVRWRVLNVRRNRNHVYRTGLWIGAHGFSSHPLATTFTGGWTAVSGTIYRRTRVSANDVEQLMVNSTDLQMLTKVSGTSPGVGEWSVSAPDLYINTGADPAGKSIFLKRYPHGPFVDEDCIARNVTNYDGNEGSGFHSDDGTGPITHRRCLSYENEGSGFRSYRGESVIREHCIAHSNVLSGFSSECVVSPEDRSCTSVSNGRYGVIYEGGSGGEAKNCLMVGNATDGVATSGTGLRVSAEHTGFTSFTNAVSGNLGSTQVFGTGADATEVAAPDIDADFRPSLASPLVGVGTHTEYSRDFDGVQCFNPPTIGAYEPLRARSAATTRNPRI